MNISFFRKAFKLIGLLYVSYVVFIICISLILKSDLTKNSVHRAIVSSGYFELDKKPSTTLSSIKIPSGTFNLGEGELLSWQEIDIHHNIIKLAFFSIHWDVNINKPRLRLSGLPKSDTSESTNSESTPIPSFPDLPRLFIPIPIKLGLKISDLWVSDEDKLRINGVDLDFQAQAFLSKFRQGMYLNIRETSDIRYKGFKAVLPLSLNVDIDQLRYINSTFLLEGASIDTGGIQINNLNSSYNISSSLLGKTLKLDIPSLLVDNLFKLSSSIEVQLDDLASPTVIQNSNLSFDLSKLDSFISGIDLTPILKTKGSLKTKSKIELSESPEKVIGSFHLDNLLLSMSHISPLENQTIPISMSVDGNSNQDQFNLSLEIISPDNIDISSTMYLKRNLGEAKLRIGADIESLENVFLTLEPILYKNLPLDIIPKKLSGSLSTVQDIKISLPDDKNITNIKKHALKFIDLTGSTRLDKVYTEIPKNDLRLDNLSIHFKNRLKNLLLNISLSQTIDSITATHDNNTVRTNDLDLNSSIETKVPENLDFDNIIANITSNASVDNIEIQQFTGNGFKYNTKFVLSKKHMDLKTFSFALDSLGVESEATGYIDINNLKPKDIDIKYSMNIDSKKAAQVIDEMHSSGYFESKGKVQLLDLKHLSIDCVSDFHDFSIRIGDRNNPILLVDDVNGKMPIQYRIDISKLNDDRNQKLVEKRSNTIFQASYSSVEESYSHHEKLTIDRVLVNKIDIQNISMTIDLSPTKFNILELTGSMLGGSFRTNLNVTLNPFPIHASFSVNFSDLNSYKLLNHFPKLVDQLQSWSISSNPEISGRISSHFDIRTYQASGTIDITEIGKEQLKALMYYIDPQEKDPSMSAARKALIASDINYVSIPVKHGFVGFDIGLSILRIPVPLPEVKGFPLSQILANFKQESTQEVSYDEI